MLAEDLTKLVAEVGRGAAVARMLHQPLEMRLELVVVRAVGTTFHVELKLEDIRRVQLAVDEAIELLGTVLTVHCCTCGWPPPWTIPDSTA